MTLVPKSCPGIPKQLQKQEGELTGPGNYLLRVLGTFQAKLSWKGRSNGKTVYVMPSQDPPLLGFPAMQALGVIRFTDSASDSTVTPKDSLFDGLGELQDEYVILLLDKPVREELIKLESQGVNRRLDRPTPWRCGMVAVPKPGGGYRICVDLTQHKEVVLRERHILPSVENILGRLRSAKVFSKLDATARFPQVKIYEKSQELTTFVTQMGRFCFQRLPIGMRSAQEYFERPISRIWKV